MKQRHATPSERGVFLFLRAEKILIQSLLTEWVETSFIDNQEWLLNHQTALNPTKLKIAGLVEADGSWDFSYADKAHARMPHSEIIFRPQSPDEGVQWLNYSPEAWVRNAKAKLEGRPYRVTFDCEPSHRGAKLSDYLRYSVDLMDEADTQGLLLDLWGLPAQFLLMFTNDPDDITHGKWDEFLRVAGTLRHKVTVDYHTYTGLCLPAGTYDDTYLRRIATEPELLRDPATWATWEQITKERPYQTRHLFRHLWLNYRALEKGYQPHTYFIGEAPFDYFGNEWDLGDTWRHANGIAGSDLDMCLEDKRYVSGIRTLYNFTRWKFPQWDFPTAIVKQLEWYGKLLAHDPNCQGWALYAYTTKQGDQQPYNWGAHKTILDRILDINPASLLLELPPSTPPVPDDTEPPAPDTSELLTLFDETIAHLRAALGTCERARGMISGG